MKKVLRENIIIKYKFDYILDCFEHIISYIKDFGITFHSITLPNGIVIDALNLDKFKILLDISIYEFLEEGLNLIADGVNEDIFNMYLDCKTNKIIKYDDSIIIEQVFLLKYFLKFIYLGKKEELNNFIYEIKGNFYS